MMSSVKSCYLGQIPLAVPKEILPGPCRARSFKCTGLHALQQKRERTIKISASAEDRGGGMDDLDVAVFRFTLGIPGFDDALIPRVVGVVGALLLVLNHFLSDSSPTDAQVRAEALGAVLAAVGLVTPTLEQLIKEQQPGRGRLAAAETVQGANRVFALESSLAEQAQQDAAWSSFALLRNSNTCGVVVVWEGRVVMCRGLLGLPPPVQAAATMEGGAGPNTEAILSGFTQAFAAAPPLAPAYYADRLSIQAAGGGGALPCVCPGIQSVLVQPLQPLKERSGGVSTARENFSAEQPAQRGAGDGQQAAPKGWLLLMSERPRALSGTERAWAAAVAGKLWAALGR